MQALPRLRTREADTTSYVADYLTRSVRRASGFVLARYTGRNRDPHAINSGLPGKSEIISTLRRNYLARFSKTSFATDRAENALGQPA